MAKRKMSSSPELALAEPISVFNKPLTLDLTRLFGALGKGLVHGVASKWPEFGVDIVDAIGAIGLQTTPEEVAYILVQKSLANAVFTLFAESSSQLGGRDAGDGVVLPELENTKIEVTLGSRFLDKPAELTLVSDFQVLLRNFLAQHATETSIIDSVVARFPSYFVYALVNEWRRDAKAYSPILDALKTPFTAAGEREWGWATYTALLNKRINEGIFDEAFSLEQIFISPYAYYEERGESREPSGTGLTSTLSANRIVVDLDHELTEWLKSKSATDSIRVISGGPGSGKSSFARVFAAKAARQSSRKVLFIPLHLIDATRDLADAVGRFVRDEDVLLHNPLDPSISDNELLIIFDGLDELASQGKAAAETARLFIREVEKTVERRNQDKPRLKILISGRELVVQENDSEFRKNRQILSLLPYFVAGTNAGPHFSATDGYNYSDPKKLLRNDLRQRWWKKYGQLTGKGYQELPGDLQRDDLDEITAQPLLNYLVALSYTRKKLDFSQAIGLNSIYADLLAAVYERGYERHRIFGPIRHMKSDDFSRVLEEIGLAAWHGDGRTTTVREIEQHCKDSGVGALLDQFKDGAEAGVTRLLAAFFFRQHGQRAAGDPTFVFTHKSFGEYLAARRVARAAKKVTRELLRRASDPDEGWDEKSAMKHWAEITAPSAMTRYIHTFFLNELRLIDSDTLLEMHSYFTRLFKLTLGYGLPMHQLGLATFGDELFQSRNAEEALLVCLNACSRVLKRQAIFELTNPAIFGKWLKRIQEQRTGMESALALDCLSLISLDGQCIDICDLWGSTLQGSSFVDGRAHYTTFCYADLSGADFTGMVAILANFERANAVGASFVGAQLNESRFFQARLRDANFQKAQLQDANFEFADLTGADFTGARLDRARFNGAILDKTLFDGADLTELTAEKEDSRRPTTHQQFNAREAAQL